MRNELLPSSRTTQISDEALLAIEILKQSRSANSAQDAYRSLLNIDFYRKKEYENKAKQIEITNNGIEGSSREDEPLRKKTALERLAADFHLSEEEFLRAAFGDDPNIWIEVVEDRGPPQNFRIDISQNYNDRIEAFLEQLFQQRNSPPPRVNHWLSEHLQRLPPMETLMTMSLDHISTNKRRFRGTRQDGGICALTLKIPEMNLETIKEVARQRLEGSDGCTPIVRGILDHYLEHIYGVGDIVPKPEKIEKPALRKPRNDV